MKNKALQAIVAFSFLCLTSCDSGTYDQRLSDLLNKAGQEADLASTLYRTLTPISGTGKGVKIPQLFAGTSSKVVTSAPQGQPPLCKIPGLSWTYQMIPAEGEKLPVYCYMGSVVKTEKKASEVMDSILNEVKTKVSGSLFKKMTIEGNEFHRLKVTTTQTFDGSADGGEKKDVEGDFELYLYQTESHHVLVGWRVPTSLASSLGFSRAVQLSMGSIANVK